MNKLLMVGLAACVSCYVQSATFAQEQTKFKKENFSYNEWTEREIFRSCYGDKSRQVHLLSGNRS